MRSTLSVSHLTKTYASGLHALKDVSLEIRRGEIFALLGPNGAGKTTLINIVCGIVKPTHGQVLADGHDIVRDYRAARPRVDGSWPVPPIWRATTGRLAPAWPGCRSNSPPTCPSRSAPRCATA